MIEHVVPYLDMTSYVLLIAFLTMILGIVNVLVSSYVTRKREKELYYTVGMTAKQIRRVGAMEMLSCFLVAMILAPIFATVLLFLLDFSMISFGIDLIPKR